MSSRAWRFSRRASTLLATLALAALGAAVTWAPAAADPCPPSCPPVWNGDGTVTFRFYSATATSVSVVGEWADPIGTASQAMTRDLVTGVWSASVALRNNLYSYTFTVDGTAGVVDPSNPPWDAEGLQSQVFVPGSNSPATPIENYGWLSPYNSVAHGTLHKHFISTVNSTGSFAGGAHPLAVYTPPGYDPGGPRRYPTLYLSHGAGGNDVDWSTQGYAGFIEDNLIAAGLAPPMVIVMTNYYNTSGSADGYREDLLSSYIPFVEANYKVYTPRWSRIFGGLSMGAAYGQNIIINSSDQFAYFGIWSPACVDTGYSCASPTVVQLSEPGPQSLLGVHIGSGIDDIFGAEATVATEEANLSAAGIPHRRHMTPTDVSPMAPVADWPRLTNHTWNVWREELRDALAHTFFKVTTATTTTLTDDYAAPNVGQPVTFTARVRAANAKIGDPDVGTVAFDYNGTHHASPVSSGGVATWETTLQAGEEIDVSARFEPAAGSPYLPSSIGSPTAGLPGGGPPALYGPETLLPAPAGWPFGESFPRTCGAGRVAGGALFWTDFLYDDQGAIGAGPPENESAGAPSFGTYKYPEADAAANGADIFRVAVGADATDTWWRVDWNTLIDPALPIAAFGIDADGNAGTGAAAWPANAALRSPGLELVLVVSSRGAWLYNLALPPAPPLDVVGAGGAVFADAAARSFVARLPRSAFDPSGTSTLYAAAGLANPTGDGFLQLDAVHGALPTQPNVYNVAFRDYADEAPSPWMDMTQSIALVTGDASAFSAPVDWARLLAGATDPEPLVTGYVNRWYVSSVEPGQGITVLNPLGPHYLGRVQPYMAFVPSTYDGSVPAPITFWLHGGSANHNSQASQNPNTLQLMCEDRGSICVVTLGRGPLGLNANDAELDYWEVWRALAADFVTDPDRTIQSGYSMGALGSYKFTENYPDLYAAVVIMAGTDIGPPDPTADGRQLENLRWTPYYHNHGGLDQLVPVAGAQLTVQALDALGYRYRFDLYPAQDHIAYSILDHFEDAIQFMTEQGTRVVDPGRITYHWLPSEVDPLGRFGPTGAWWVDGAVARDPGTDDARVDASSLAKPDPALAQLVRSTETRPDAQPSPAERQELRWVLSAPPFPERRLTLDLQNVGTVTLDLARAGLVPVGTPGDWDGDAVPDGVDNCPFVSNPGQENRGAVHRDPPDGIGDACQCGDVTGNGVVNGQDGFMIVRHGLGLEPNPLFVEECNCDVNGDGACNGVDGIAVTRQALGLSPNPVFANACPSLTGLRSIDVQSDGPSDVILAALVPDTQVALDGVPVGAAGGDGSALVSVPSGVHQIRLSP